MTKTIQSARFSKDFPADRNFDNDDIYYANHPHVRGIQLENVPTNNDLALVIIPELTPAFLADFPPDERFEDEVYYARHPHVKNGVSSQCSSSLFYQPNTATTETQATLDKKPTA